jgi:hypothetical protein
LVRRFASSNFRQHGEQRAGAALLHLHRDAEHIECAFGQQALHGIGQHLRAQVIEIRFEHHDFLKCASQTRHSMFGDVFGDAFALFHPRWLLRWSAASRFGCSGNSRVPAPYPLFSIFIAGKRREAVAQRLHDRRARGRYQFDLWPRRIYRRIPQQPQRRRRGYGKRSVRALDGSSADVQRRAYPFFDRKRFRSHGGADDIHHGIDGADFVKVDLLDGSIVNLGFGLAQSFENANCGRLRRAADR